MDDEVVFILDNTTVTWILKELVGEEYNEQTNFARYLIDYTSHRSRKLPLYTMSSIYGELRQELAPKQFSTIGAVLSDKGTSKGDNTLNELFALAEIIKIEDKCEKLYLITNDSTLTQEKIIQIKARGIRDVLSLEAVATYIKNKDGMRAHIERAQIHDPEYSAEPPTS